MEDVESSDDEDGAHADDEYIYNTKWEDSAFADLCVPAMIDEMIARGKQEGYQYLADKDITDGFRQFTKLYEKIQRRLYNYEFQNQIYRHPLYYAFAYGRMNVKNSFIQTRFWFMNKIRDNFSTQILMVTIENINRH